MSTLLKNRVSLDEESTISIKGTTSQQDVLLKPTTWYPCTPSGTQRFDLNRTVEDKCASRVIEPLTVSFPVEATLPPGWERHIHPLGLPYFVLYLPDGGQLRRIVTEEWMYDPEVSTLVNNFTKQIRDAISDQNTPLWPESDLFVQLERKKGELTRDGGHARCGYYFVHHERRCIYWLEGFELDPSVSLPLRNMRGDLTGYQTQMCLEAEYWMYWSLFPTLHSVTPDIHDHIVEIITNVSTDVISATEYASTIFTYESLTRMLKVVQLAKASDTSSWYIGHFMYQLVNDQLRNYSGSWGARLNRGESVIRKAPKPQSLLLDLISPFLLFIPHAQLERLEAVITDGFVTLPKWEQLIVRIQEERKETTMIALGTILVNLISQAGPIFRSQRVEAYSQLLQSASHMSLIMSFFGALLGILMWRDQKFKRPHRWHRTMSEFFANVDKASASDPDYRKLDHLVLIWSVPHALVVWSAILLSAAWLLFCFVGNSTNTRTILGVHVSVLGALTLYFLVRFRIVTKPMGIWFWRVVEHWRAAGASRSRVALE